MWVHLIYSSERSIDIDCRAVSVLTDRGNNDGKEKRKKRIYIMGLMSASYYRITWKTFHAHPITPGEQSVSREMIDADEGRCVRNI